MKRSGFKRKPRVWSKKGANNAVKAKLRASQRKLRKHAKKQLGSRIWSMKRADDEISLHVRERDGKCMFPNCTVTDIKKLQCSHYIGRAHKATRYDPDNLIALCWYHHFKSKDLGYEYQKQRVEKQGWDGQYTLFMKKWLGEERWQKLLSKEKQIYPLSQAIIDCMKYLNML
jgi:hypothetical protein